MAAECCWARKKRPHPSPEIGKSPQKLSKGSIDARKAGGVKSLFAWAARSGKNDPERMARKGRMKSTPPEATEEGQSNYGSKKQPGFFAGGSKRGSMKII